MKDREVANRFCAFALLGYQKHKGDTDSFLAEGLDVMNRLGEPELKALSQRFRRGLENNIQLFGRHAFRKHEPGQKPRHPFNVALFDAFSVLLAGVEPERAAAHAEALRQGFFSLIPNAWTQPHIDASLQTAERPLQSWSDLVRWAKRECSHLTLAPDVIAFLEGLPFVPGAAEIGPKITKR